MCEGYCCLQPDDFRRKPIDEIVQNNKRKCTDGPCWIILMFILIGELYLIVYSFEKGATPESLWKGYDYLGDWCDEDHPDGSLNAWIDPEESYTFRICVKDCSQTTVDGNDDRMVGYYNSEKFLDAYCVPTNSDSSIQFTAYSKFGDYGQELSRSMSDLEIGKWVIIGCAILSLFLGFLYLKVVEWIGAFILWAVVILLYVGGIFGAWFFLSQGIPDLQDDIENETAIQQVVIGASIIFGLCILTCFLAWFHRRVEMALIMLDQAGDAINDMKSVLFWPIFYTIPVIFYFTIWLVIALLIYSVKEGHAKSEPDWLLNSNSSLASDEWITYIYYEWDDSLRYAMIFHILVLLFSTQLIIYFNYMVLSGAIADWYFSDWDASLGNGQDFKIRGNKKSELGEWPIIESFWRVIRYHIGTLIFGSLIIFIVTIIRMLVGVAKGANETDKPNVFTKIVRCCCLCCLECCDCILDRASKSGFIFCSIYGTNFCYSSHQAIKLLWSNVSKLVLMEGISNLMEYIGRFGIALITLSFAILAFETIPYYNEHLSSYLYPAMFIFVISYIIGSLFMMVFEVGVETIFLCYLVDERVNHTPRFASDKLIKVGIRYGRAMLRSSARNTQEALMVQQKL